MRFAVSDRHFGKRGDRRWYAADDRRPTAFDDAPIVLNNFRISEAVGRRNDDMPACGQDRQPAVMVPPTWNRGKPSIAVSNSIQSVNLSETPGGMNLVAVRQLDELRTAGRPAGVEQRAHGVAIGGEPKLKGVMLYGKSRVEADHVRPGSLSPPMTKTDRSVGTRSMTAFAFRQIPHRLPADGITSTSAFSAINNRLRHRPSVDS